MFYGCSSLEELNINNFNTNNVINMNCMFCKCLALKELNINNLDINNVTNLYYMFDGCSEEFITKIRIQYKNIKEKAFGY